MVLGYLIGVVLLIFFNKDFIRDLSFDILIYFLCIYNVISYVLFSGDLRK